MLNSVSLIRHGMDSPILPATRFCAGGQIANRTRPTPDLSAPGLVGRAADFPFPRIVYRNT